MYKKTIEYTDYNGDKRKEDYYFQLSVPECTQLANSVDGGLDKFIEKIISSHDNKEIISLFDKIVSLSYGEKSADGRRFIKVDDNGNRLVNHFIDSEAYNILYTQFFTDANLAADFVNGIIPSKLIEQVNNQTENNANTNA